MSIIAEPDFPSIVYVSPPSTLIYCEENSSGTPTIAKSSALSSRLSSHFCVLQNQVGGLAACLDSYTHANASAVLLVDIPATAQVASVVSAEQRFSCRSCLRLSAAGLTEAPYCPQRLRDAYVRTHLFPKPQQSDSANQRAGVGLQAGEGEGPHLYYLVLWC